MDVRVHTVRLGSFRDLDQARHGHVDFFRDQIANSAPSLGTFLDIGCGGQLQPPFVPLVSKVREYHGIDPTDAVQQHPLAVRKFEGPFETTDLPKDSYDTAFAYNVLEHIEAGPPFFRQVHAVLKPGGSFWALTPHARHPFAWLANMARWFSAKKLYRKNVLAEGVNEYASYYRLNSPGAVTKAIGDLGFRSADFWMLPCLQWDSYWPGALRFMPHLYDRTIGGRVGAGMLLMTMRLTKA